MDQILIALLGFERIHYPFDILRAVFMSDQNRVRCLDDDQVCHAHGRYQSMLRAYVAVVNIVGVNIANGHIPGGIGLAGLPQCGPGTDIAPTDVGFNHDRSAGFFHDRIVDRV